MKLSEAEKEFGRKLNDHEHKVLRDCLIAEVCEIELKDPRIRQAHGMEPAQ